jgi:hypothetical protein
MGTCAAPCTGRPRLSRGQASSPIELAGYRNSSQVGRGRRQRRVSDVANLCFKGFRLDVSKVDLGCVCCNNDIHMLQAYVSSVSYISNVCFKCFIWMLHMLLWLYTYVLSICFECFKCFRLMLQVFYLNVAQVDMDITYVVIYTHV